MKLVKIITFIIFESRDLIILKLNLYWSRNRLNNLCCEDVDDDDNDRRLMIMMLLSSQTSSFSLFKKFHNYMRYVFSQL
jgi:hypothetical protein